MIITGIQRIKASSLATKASSSRGLTKAAKLASTTAKTAVNNTATIITRQCTSE